jgi:hypothetical protein
MLWQGWEIGYGRVYLGNTSAWRENPLESGYFEYQRNGRVLSESTPLKYVSRTGNRLNWLRTVIRFGTDPRDAGETQGL